MQELLTQDCVQANTGCNAWSELLSVHGLTGRTQYLQGELLVRENAVRKTWERGWELPFPWLLLHSQWRWLRLSQTSCELYHTS